MCGARFQIAQITLTTFMKVHIMGPLSLKILFRYICNVSDFFLSTELIPKKRLKKWIEREGFGVRKILILKWILLGNVLTVAYKSTLLSTLVTTRYNKPIDTLEDLYRSGIPLLIAKGSQCHGPMENDQRPIMKQIYRTSIVLEYNQQTEVEFAEM